MGVSHPSLTSWIEFMPRIGFIFVQSIGVVVCNIQYTRVQIFSQNISYKDTNGGIGTIFFTRENEVKENWHANML